MRWPTLFTKIEAFAIAVQRLLSRRLRRRRQQPTGWEPYHLVALCSLAVAAHATTVTPPSFPQLVREAQVIAQGTVTDVSARWVDGPQGHLIKTFVTFAVEKTLKGSPGTAMTLEFLGGTVGADTMKVSGMPQFHVGETEILFVTGNGTQFCPLVHFMHGRFHVRSDAATHRRFVSRDDDTPLGSVADVQQPADEHGAPRRQALSANALSPDDFETQVAAEIAQPTH